MCLAIVIASSSKRVGVQWGKHGQNIENS